MTDEKPWVVYFIECVTPFHYYVGMTNNLVRRIQEHRRGKASRFTVKHGISIVRQVGEFRTRLGAEAAENVLTRELELTNSMWVVRGGDFSEQNRRLRERR